MFCTSSHSSLHSCHCFPTTRTCSSLVQLFFLKVGYLFTHVTVFLQSGYAVHFCNCFSTIRVYVCTSSHSVLHIRVCVLHVHKSFYYSCMWLFFYNQDMLFTHLTVFLQSGYVFCTSMSNSALHSCGCFSTIRVCSSFI